MDLEEGARCLSPGSLDRKNRKQHGHPVTPALFACGEAEGSRRIQHIQLLCVSAGSTEVTTLNLAKGITQLL